MAHALKVFHAMLGKKYPKTLSLKRIGHSLLALVCLIRGLDLSKFAQIMIEIDLDIVKPYMYIKVIYIIVT